MALLTLLENEIAIAFLQYTLDEHTYTQGAVKKTKLSSKAIDTRSIESSPCVGPNHFYMLAYGYDGAVQW